LDENRVPHHIQQRSQPGVEVACDCLQVGPREQLTEDHALECPRVQQRLNENRAPHYIQQHSSLEVAQL